MGKDGGKSSGERAADQPQPFGGRLRTLRTSRNLTLEQLSTMAGVSKAMLSQIEQNKVNPTVAVMLKIATALELSIGDLVDAPERSNIIRIIPASDDRYTFRADPSCSIRTLSPLNLEKNIEFYRVSLEHRAELDSEPHFPGTEEFLFLNKGRLRVTTGGQATDLGRGDAIHYRADVPHSIANVGRGRAEAYMIVHYREA
ncbi:MAG: helix-turn-helix domain-containing protein [Planctomycetota bacterium]